MAQRVALNVYEYNAIHREWTLPIGELLMAFASCEYWTYQYVFAFGAERERQAVKKMPLLTRIELAQQVAGALPGDEAAQRRLHAAFGALKELAIMRNLVAHGTPMAHAYKNEQTEQIEVRHELRDIRDPEGRITIQEIQLRTAEAVRLDAELADLFDEMCQQDLQAQPSA